MAYVFQCVTKLFYDMIYQGSDLKINVSFDAGNGKTMDDLDFYCIFTCGFKKCEIKKEQMIRIDSKNYLACIRGDQTTKGEIICECRIKLPDDHFDDGIRNEVCRARLEDVIS